jgi:hypothetical protein
MIIYRIEDQNHYGPFQNDDLRFELAVAGLLDTYNSQSMPAPWQDGITDFDPFEGNRDKVFGVTSLQCLKQWFGPMMPVLSTFEQYRITEYDVPESYVRLGHHQAMFWRSHASPIKSEPITVLESI